MSILPLSGDSNGADGTPDSYSAGFQAVAYPRVFLREHPWICNMLGISYLGNRERMIGE